MHEPKTNLTVQEDKIKKPDLDSLVRYYHDRLTAETKTYLYERGLSDQTIEAFQIGYDDGVQFGFIENAGALGDYFQDRFIFPIKDINGKVVNIVGRAGDNRQPSYKNLPSHLVINPDVLFNEAVIGSSDTIFLCEGIIDALTLLQVNFPAVGIFGPNSFKPGWAEKFTSKHVFICFDNDEVGRIGRDQVARLISEKAAAVYFVSLPEGIKDVNDFFRRVKDAAQNFSLLAYQAAEWGKYRQFPSDARNLNAFVQEYARRHAKKMVGLPTGFAKLDEILFGGLLPGLYILYGPPASGKTTFLKNTADHLAANRIPVIFISLEMSAFELWAKSISRLAGVPVQDVFTGKADPDAIRQANQEYSKLAAYIWTVEGSGPASAGIIDSYVYQTVNELGVPPVVCVDYLQRLPVESAQTVLSQEMSDSFNVLALKRISQKYSCPVLAASVGKAAGDAAPPPAVLYTADVVMELEMSPENGEDGGICPVNLQIRKNRNGVLGQVPLRFDKTKSVLEAAE
ncbi:MAG: DnaB-like helicase C-terminal domain-containing protein [bacterium]|jgi:replicative DNA helicase